MRLLRLFAAILFSDSVVSATASHPGAPCLCQHSAVRNPGPEQRNSLPTGYPEALQVLPRRHSRPCAKPHRRGQPLQSGARNAKNAPESAICGVLRKRSPTTGSMPWVVPISNPRTTPRRVRLTNLRWRAAWCHACRDHGLRSSTENHRKTTSDRLTQAYLLGPIYG